MNAPKIEQNLHVKAYFRLCIAGKIEGRSKIKGDSLRAPLVIGIAGCSGSGKTTLAYELASQLDATLFPFDSYYRDLAQLPMDLRGRRNFDHPDSYDSDLMLEHVRALARGEAVQRPVYDRRTHSRVRGSFETIAPKAVVIVEGILALHYPELAACYGFSIFVDAPEDVCLARRLDRDMRERGRTAESVREQFQAAVKPMAELFVLPSAARASIAVDGTAALEDSISQILRALRSLQERRL